MSRAKPIGIVIRCKRTGGHITFGLYLYVERGTRRVEETVQHEPHPATVCTSTTIVVDDQYLQW